jgi:ubiquinone/menaquinone biosynthesis C-methylase UbiE
MYSDARMREEHDPIPEKSSSHAERHFADAVGTHRLEMSADRLQQAYDELHSRTAFRGLRGYYDWLIGLIETSAGKSLLDVGCGSGEMLRVADARGLKTAGVDISKVGLSQAQAKVPRADLKVSWAEELPFPDASFDFVTCIGSLEHVMDITQAVREMVRVAKPGAGVLIIVPNRRFVFAFVTHLRQSLFPDHSQPVERMASRREWFDTLTGNGLSVERVVRDNHFYVPPILQFLARGLGALIPLEGSYQLAFVARTGKSDPSPIFAD